MKKILKIAAFVIAILLIVGGFVFANGLFGNPVSKMLATGTAEKHLAEKYGDRDFVLDGVVFNFKFGCYNAYISSPSSVDSSFTLSISQSGKLIQDSYEDRVESGENTAARIDLEYRNSVDSVLDKAFPYDTDIGYGEIVFVLREYSGDSSVQEYAIITEDLIIDADYSIKEMGARAGKLTLYVYDDTVSAERLSEIVLDVKRIFDGAEVAFYALDCVLEYPKAEDGSKKEGRVEVMEFLYSDIYEEGITERVKASNDKAMAYYAEQDAEKRKDEALDG